MASPMVMRPDQVHPLFDCAEDYEAGLEVCVALEVEDMVQDNFERKFKVRSVSSVFGPQECTFNHESLVVAA